MPGFVFDVEGNVYPRQVIDITAQTIKERFVEAFPESKTRSNIFSGYLRYVGDFSRDVGPAWGQWVNGSFTTTKVNPNDIDLVNLVGAGEVNRAGAKFRKFLTEHGSKETYLVDGYFIPCYPEGDERSAITRKRVAYWLKHFGHDRRDRPKGLLQVRFDFRAAAQAG